MTSSSTFPAARACRMTSAPPPMATSPSPAASVACGEGRVEVGDEPEARCRPPAGPRCGGSARTGARERVRPAPRARRVVHAAADHSGGQRRDELVVELLVPAVHREVVAAVVGPRAAHHPVVQALATPAQALLGPVVGTGDVAVDRRGDGCDDLAHGSSSVECHEDRPGRAPPTHRFSPEAGRKPVCDPPWQRRRRRGSRSLRGWPPSSSP